MSRRPVLVLWDIDGTLLLTGGAGLRAFERAGAELFGDASYFEGLETAGGLDPLIYAEAIGRSGLAGALERHHEFRSSYLRILPLELRTSAATVRRLPGVLETIEALRTREGTTQGLLTGNYAEAIPVKLSAVGLDPGVFEVVACGDDADSRPGLGRVALERFAARTGRAIPPASVVIVGDTPKDVDCARANGFFAFAVATGKYSAEELEAAGADQVVADLADPTPLLDRVEALRESSPGL